MTLVLNPVLGEYYGVQGTTWTNPPLLRSPSGTRDIDGKKLLPVRQRRPPDDGGLAQRARACYWISNTLTSTIPNPQMVGIAASLTPRPLAGALRPAGRSRRTSLPSPRHGFRTPTHRGDRHRLRRPGDRRRLRRARLRGLVRRRRRRQDRAPQARRDPDLRARPGRVGGAQLASGCTSPPSWRPALEHARLLFVAVGTPPTYSGDADLSAVHAVVESMPRSDHHALVMKSTVPVGTGASIKRIFAEHGKEGFAYVSCPEFLKEGSALEDFLEPDRVVVGDDGNWAGDAVVSALRAPRRARGAHRHRLGRDGQAGRQRVPGHQDQLHQRDRQRVRGDRRRRARGGAGDGPGPADRPPLPQARDRLRRLLLPQGRLGAQAAGRQLRATTSSC